MEATASKLLPNRVSQVPWGAEGRRGGASAGFASLRSPPPVVPLPIPAPLPNPAIPWNPAHPVPFLTFHFLSCLSPRAGEQASKLCSSLHHPAVNSPLTLVISITALLGAHCRRFEVSAFYTTFLSTFSTTAFLPFLSFLKIHRALSLRRAFAPFAV